MIIEWTYKEIGLSWRFIWKVKHIKWQVNMMHNVNVWNGYADLLVRNIFNVLR